MVYNNKKKCFLLWGSTFCCFYIRFVPKNVELYGKFGRKSVGKIWRFGRKNVILHRNH